MAKKKCKCEEKEQTAFLAYQSGSDDKEAMDLVFECVGELAIALKEKHIRLYTVIQSGVPNPLCGIPGYPHCK